jgi:hypothetical protein
MLVFYGDRFLVPHANPKLKDYPLLTLHDCLFNIFVCSTSGEHFLHQQPEDAQYHFYLFFPHIINTNKVAVNRTSLHVLCSTTSCQLPNTTESKHLFLEIQAMWSVYIFRTACSRPKTCFQGNLLSY